MGTCCSKAIVSATAPSNDEHPASSYVEYTPATGTSVDKSFASTPLTASKGVEGALGAVEAAGSATDGSRAA